METRGTSDSHFSLTLTMDNELTTYSGQRVKIHMPNTVHKELKHTRTRTINNSLLYTLMTLYHTTQITTIYTDVAMTQALTNILFVNRSHSSGILPRKQSTKTMLLLLLLLNTNRT